MERMNFLDKMKFTILYDWLRVQMPKKYLGKLMLEYPSLSWTEKAYEKVFDMPMKEIIKKGYADRRK